MVFHSVSQSTYVEYYISSVILGSEVQKMMKTQYLLSRNVWSKDGETHKGAEVVGNTRQSSVGHRNRSPGSRERAVRRAGCAAEVATQDGLPSAELWLTGVCQELGLVEETSRQIEYMDSNGEAGCRLVKGPAQLRQIPYEAVEDMHRGQERKAGGWRQGHTEAHMPGSGIQALLPTPGVCKLCQRPDGK